MVGDATKTNQVARLAHGRLTICCPKRPLNRLRLTPRLKTLRPRSFDGWPPTSFQNLLYIANFDSSTQQAVRYQAFTNAYLFHVFRFNQLKK